jgi:serine/threonine-protein kinase RsbW
LGSLTFRTLYYSVMAVDPSSPGARSRVSVVEVTLESTLKNVEVAEEISRRVSRTAGLDPEAAFQIEMAVHETVINAIYHGNKQDPGKSVLLGFRIFGDRIEIRVRDQGSGFDPGRLPDPVADENLLNVSGRGIFLVRKFMDELKIETSAGSGTEVIMVKHLNSTR